MSGPIDRATFDRLVARSRDSGAITASELQAALPVESMDVDTLVLVMLELEAAGVSVEPDVLGPRTDAVLRSPLSLDGPKPGVSPGMAPVGAGPRLEGGADRPAPPAANDAAGDDGDDGVGRVVLLAGILLVLVLGTILVVL